MKTPLWEKHQIQGATLKDFDGWELPEQFSGPLEEYGAVREKAGLLDLSFQAQVLATGADRVSFLQGMLSNDVRRLGPGEGCYATMLTDQGRVVADFRVYALPEAFLLEVDARIKDKLIQALSRYLIADEVELEDVSEQWATLGVQGPLSAAVLEKALGEPPSLAQEYQHREGRLGEASVRLMRVSLTGEEGYEVLLSREAAEEVWETLLEAGRPLGLKPVGMAALEILRVEAALPRYGVDMDESRLVLEVGLEGALSRGKGCYLGQEVVERATARGHVNRRLMGLKIQGGTLPERGDRIFSESREIGWVTSAVYSPYLGSPAALAYVRREFWHPGTQVRIDRKGETVLAEIVALPFYKKNKT